ncbi:MAG: hypothetical protein Q4A13_05635 [Fretibacterium sp.]|nr:hypothetical protein [Fretibacterium sp.]
MRKAVFREVMRRRRGSILITAMIVVMVLAIFSGGIFTFAYINHKSELQQYGVFRARAVADALLHAIGSVVSDDFARGVPVISITKGTPLVAVIEDDPFFANIRLATSDDQLFSLECSVRYNEWESGARRLELLKKTLGSSVESSWIWR